MSSESSKGLGRREFLAATGTLGITAASTDILDDFLSDAESIRKRLSRAARDAQDETEPDKWAQRAREELDDGELDGNTYEGPASDYITPEDEIVEHWAKKADLKKHKDESYRVDLNDHWDELKFEYISDEEQFGKMDKWLKPREYLENGAKGDCEDYSLAMTSILEAMGYPSVNVIGYYDTGDSEGGHSIAETVIDGDVYVADVHMPCWLAPRERYYEEMEWWDREMFSDDMSRRSYSSDWFEEKV